jgi:hypothetical protein
MLCNCRWREAWKREASRGQRDDLAGHAAAARFQEQRNSFKLSPLQGSHQLAIRVDWRPGASSRDFDLESGERTSSVGRSNMESRAKHWLMGIVVVAALVNVAWARDVWKDKKLADWSAKDMAKFMTRSPWARTVQPATPPPSMDQGPMGAGTGGWSGPPGGGGDGGRGNMGGGAMGGGMQMTTFQVRWVSAPIMRQALVVAEAESELMNTTIAKYAKDYYIISVTMQVKGEAVAGGGRNPRGGAPGGGAAGSGQWGAPTGGGTGTSKGQQEEGRKRLDAMLVRGVTLRFAGQSVHPVRAEMTPSEAGIATLYLFPRSLKLEEADKNYVFELTQGPIVTRANFSLKGFEQAPEKGL